jgi:hypothetical protein
VPRKPTDDSDDAGWTVRDGEGDAVDANAVDPADRIADIAPRHTPLWAFLSAWLLGVEAWLRSHGGTKLRVSLWGFWALVGIAGTVLLAGPVINKPVTLDDITDSASTATETWIARDFAVDYTLSRSDDGRLVAEVEERITALFPDDVNEQGIERVLATQYEGHSLRPDNIELTLDGAGTTPEFSETAETLTISLDTGSRLQGDHEIVLRYTLNDLAYSSVDESTDQPVDLLRWDVFGPAWGQAFAGLEVNVIVPQDINEELIRQPRGSFAWTILSDGEWMDPEPGGQSNAATYQFTVDQNIPPNAQAGFLMSFEPGTFAMPAPSALYWVQVYGPLAPLAFLAMTLLLALAARAVAWGDARGRPWFVAQYTPPEKISPAMAAQLLREPAMVELAESLEGLRLGRRRVKRRVYADGTTKPTRRELQVSAAHAARRAGRIGNLPRALNRYYLAPERREQLSRGFRRIPRGFVRDLFIAAPIALTLVQWGLLRQLSEQRILAVVWWPATFFFVSVAISVVVVWIALSSRPLTRRGALLKQHLRGIQVYSERTRLLERGVVTDRVLPYAVLTGSRDDAKRLGAAVEAEMGDPNATRGWQTHDFYSWPRLLVRALSVLLVAGTLTAATTLPDPYPRDLRDYALYSYDLEGTFAAKVQTIDIAGELSRSDAGHARVDVAERFTVEFDAESSEIPQFARQWPTAVDGQNLGLRLLSVTIDGDDVPHTSTLIDDTMLLETQLAAPLSGAHTVEVRYALETAATAAGATGGAVDTVRWAALLEGWENDDTWDRDPVPAPFRIEFGMSQELAATVTSAGWIAVDTTGDYRQWAPSVLPFEAGGAEGPHTLDLAQDEYGSWPIEVTLDDLGVSAEFPAGTFVEPSPGALRVTQFVAVAPLLSVLLLAVFAVAFPVWHLVWGRRYTRRGLTPGPLRDFVRWAAPAAAVSACIVFLWATMHMSADNTDFAPMAWSCLAAILGGIAGYVLTRASLVQQAMSDAPERAS